MATLPHYVPHRARKRGQICKSMNPTQKSTSVSYSFVMRLTYPNRIGMFAKLAAVIGKEGGDLGAVDIVSPDSKRMVRDVTVRGEAVV